MRVILCSSLLDCTYMSWGGSITARITSHRASVPPELEKLAVAKQDEVSAQLCSQRWWNEGHLEQPFARRHTHVVGRLNHRAFV